MLAGQYQAHHYFPAARKSMQGVKTGAALVKKVVKSKVAAKS